MPDIGNTSVFSQTDASNGSGTQPSWLGSAAPSTLDDAGRALQGAVTREWNWRSFTLTAGGTADVKTLTYSVAPAAYYNGQRFAFIANTTNTATATLNVNGLGAKTIKSVETGALANLAASDMIAGKYVEVAYNLANDCFVWVNQSDVLPQNLGTGDSPQFAGVNVGNASDTTITRSAAGVIAVEGGVVPKENRANTFTLGQTVSVTAGQSFMALSGDAAEFKSVQLLTSGLNRWIMLSNDTAESGSDAGSNFQLNRYSDAGVFLGTPISITRSSGLTTLTSLSVPTIDMGNTDTTISRSAAGVIAVEGNPVITAAGTASQGDVLYHNGTAWTRLAAGTSGQFLKTNGAGANPAWTSANGITNLGTITTTSGASQSLAVTLTGYKFVRLSFNGVSGTGAGNILVGSGIVVSAPAAADLVIGTVDIDLTTGYATAVMATTVAGGASSRVVATGYSTATTSIVVSLASGTLDAGSVVVYGLS